MRKTLILVGLLLMIAVPVLAQTPAPKPLFDASRISVAAGAQYAFYNGQANELPQFKKEWEAGIFAAYNMTPHLSLVGASAYGLDNKTFRTTVGIRVHLIGVPN